MTREDPSKLDVVICGVARNCARSIEELPAMTPARMTGTPPQRQSAGVEPHPEPNRPAGERRRIVFLGQGRLGNQIFQWLALATRFPGSEVWAPSWTSLSEIFDLYPPPHLKFANPLVDRLLRRKLGRQVMRTLFETLRLGHCVHEPLDADGEPSGQLVLRRGWSDLLFVDGGFYQNLSNLLRPADFQSLRLREPLRQRACDAVREALHGRPWPQIVMHVRRTDYLQFKPYGLSDVALPAAHYLRAAAEARRGLSDAQLLVVTDDSDWCRGELQRLGDFTVMHDCEAVDFAILTLFPVVVIANSTFSLAAACIGPNVQRVIAPEFWFGHRVRRWLPPAIRSNDPRFTYI